MRDKVKGPVDSVDFYLYPVASLESILKETYGVMVYQEQVMQVAQIVAGYSLGEADLLRRAMGKKIKEEMAQQRDLFTSRAVERGLDEGTAGGLFDLMEKFAEYGFNKSHSAAYALVAYQTAYLKAHHPVAFMVAQMNADIDKTDKIAKHIEECRAMRINVLPPEVNLSQARFTREGESVRFGLGGIKGLGVEMMEAVVRHRPEQGFNTIFGLCKATSTEGMNRKVLESLILSGALDNLHPTRAGMMAGIDAALEEGNRHGRDSRLGQGGLFGGTVEAVQTKVPVMVEYPYDELLLREGAAIGAFLSGHPLDPYTKELPQWGGKPIEELPALGDSNESVAIIGIPVGRQEKRTREGERMGLLQLIDQTGSIEVTIYPKVYQNFKGPLEKWGLKPMRIIGRYRDGRGSFNADHVEAIADIRSGVFRALVLSWDGEGAIAWRRVEQTLEESPGILPVVLEVELDGVGRGRWRLPRFLVRPDDELVYALAQHGLKIAWDSEGAPTWGRLH